MLAGASLDVIAGLDMPSAKYPLKGRGWPEEWLNGVARTPIRQDDEEPPANGDLRS